MTTGLISEGYPQWRYRSWSGSDGKTSENPYTGIHETGDDTNQHLYRMIPDWDTDWVDFGEGNYASATISTLRFSDPNLMLKVQSDLAEAIRGHNYNLGISAAELPESIGMLVGAVRNFGQAYKAAARGDFERAARCLARAVSARNVSATVHASNNLAKRGKRSVWVHQRNTTVRLNRVKNPKQAMTIEDISSTWVALQWGWLPVVNDIYEASRALEAKRNNFRVIYRKKAASNFSDVTPNPCKYPRLATHGIALKATLREQPTLRATLGLSDPASVIWEKIPFSAVLDWFIPIGQYLDASSFLAPLDITLVTSEFQRSTCEGSGTTLYTSGGYNWKLVSPARKASWFKLTRTSGPYVSAKPHLKTLDRIFSTKHLATGAALVNLVVLQKVETRVKRM